jgi:hypothetical protein
MKTSTQINIVLGLIALLLIGYTGGFLPISHTRDNYLDIKHSITSEMMSRGEYACCLERPCTYCIEKTPKHGEGAACNCLKDVMTGVHPCGECIGEILEGHGNKFLAPYFARAIAEEVGMHHLPLIKQIIEEKYGMLVENQI